MIFKLVGRIVESAVSAPAQILERVRYERKRFQKLAPVVLRFSIFELRKQYVERFFEVGSDFYHRFQHWRGVCDHTGQRPRVKTKSKLQKTSKRRHTAKRVAK